jgi:hypothetical protein
MDTDPLAYTISAAVKAAAVSRTELYRSAKRGELEIRKRGKRSVILADELRRWVQSLPAANSASPKRA